MESVLVDRGEMIRAFGRTLDETERFAPDRLRRYQLSLLSNLLSHARAECGFYRERLDFDTATPAQVDAAWSSIPILTRVEAAALANRLFSDTVPANAGRTLEGSTSGSTATPLHYRRSEIAVLAAQAMVERMMRWWRVDPSKPCARIAYEELSRPPEGTSHSGWHSGDSQSVQHRLSSEADIDVQIAWLAARKPAYLIAYSHVLKELASVCMREGSPTRFDLLFTLGTVVDPEVRARCADVFGVPIADSYGAAEIGQLAAECPDCGEYHVSAEAVHLEIVRDDGALARPGEIGRVVVTGLYNFAMPLIRYEIGDLAEAGSERPACGRTLPSIRRILGRYRNAFRFRAGRIMFPHTQDLQLWKFLSYRSAQVVQLDFDRVEIRWVGDQDPGTINLAALTAQVRSVLREPVEVIVTKVDAIARSRSGKFEDFVSLVPAI
jgi:phenylacetate-coenzyme A ligase PaaK-like adenylate-forming protein